MDFVRKSVISAFLALSIVFGMGLQAAMAGPVLTPWDDDENEFKEFPSFQVNYESQLYFYEWRDVGSGPEDKDSTTDFYFRRNRLIFRGFTGDTFGFNMSVEQNGSKRINTIPQRVEDNAFELFGVLDAYIIANFKSYFNVKAGLTKNRLVREHNEGCFFTLGSDRSLFVYTPLPRASRDMGVVVWGKLFQNMVQYKLAAMKGNESGDDPKSNLRYTGRVHLSLLDPEPGDLYLGTYLGRAKVLTIGAGYEIEKDAVYANLAGKSDSKDYQGMTLDIFFDYPTPIGAITVYGAYLIIDFDDAYQGADPDSRSINGLGARNGYTTKFAYLIPGKIGIGQLQLIFRYENWNYARLFDSNNQKVNWISGGLNYYIHGQKVRILVEYSRVDYSNNQNSAVDYNDVTGMFQFLY